MAVQQEVYNITESAKITGFSRDFISDRIADGTLPAFYFGTGRRRATRIRRTDLDKLFKPVPVSGYNPNATLLGASA